MPRTGDTDPPARASTASGVVATPEHNARSIEELLRDISRLKRAMDKLERADEERRALLIELAGRDGRGGKIAALEKAQERSSVSQGQRIGELEAEVRSEVKTSNYTRAQLGVLAVLGMAVLGAALKFLFAT